MTHTAFRALRGLQPRRCLPGFACFLGALAMAILAGCGTGGCSSGSMGGGSGYQVDGMPGLMSCSSTSSSTTTPNATDTIVQGMTMTFNGQSLNMLGAFTAQTPALSLYADITGITGPVSGLSGSTSPYSVAVSAAPYNVGFVYCSLHGATEWWWNTTTLNLPANTSYTLSVKYPAFTMSPVTIECQYLDNSKTWWSNVGMAAAGTP